MQENKVPMQYLQHIRIYIMGFVLFMSCVCHAFASVRRCLLVTCWERTDLLALVCDV